MSILAATVRSVDDLHVRGLHYTLADGDHASSEIVTVHMATCADYNTACERLGASKVTRVLTSTGIRHEALGYDDVLVQHMCMPHLPCYGVER